MYAAAGGASLARSRAQRANHKKHAGDGHRSNRHQNNNPSDLTFHRPVTPLPPALQEALPHKAHLHRVQEERHHSLEPPTYADLNGRITSFGSNDFMSEGQGGKAAWQERERRASVAEVAVNHRIKATEAHRRWMKRNRIHDSSFGGSSSDDDDIPGGLYGHQSAAANALLYVGLGTVAIGFVIFFVGTGEKGFKTVELRLIGPTLIVGGFLCCLIRVLLCVCPSRCLRRRRKHRRRHKQGGLTRYDEHGYPEASNKVEEIQLVDQTTSLVRNNSCGRSRAAPPPQPPKLVNSPPPLQAKASSSSREQYPIIASTTKFLQNEKDDVANFYNSHYQIPTINIPNFVVNSDEDDNLSCVLQNLQQTSPTGTYDLLEYELQQMDIADYGFDREFGSRVGTSRDDDASSHRDRDYGRVKDFLQIDNDPNKEYPKTTSKLNKPRAPANGRSMSASAASSRTRGLGLLSPDVDTLRLEDEIVKPKRAFTNSSSSGTPKHKDVDALLKNEIVLSPSKLHQQHLREQ